MPHRALLAPATSFAASYIEALREGHQLGDDPPFAPDAIAAVAADFPAHLTAITRQGVLHTFPDGSALPLSPFTLFWFIEDGATFLGSFYLRHELANDYARRFTGHVRYGVRPSRRQQGIGTAMLTAARVEAARFGFHRILVVCREANIASRRLIETCGGEFESAVEDPYGEGIKRRYWIAISADICHRNLTPGLATRNRQ
jgi:predicted acetyltransferase